MAVASSLIRGYQASRIFSLEGPWAAARSSAEGSQMRSDVSESSEVVLQPSSAWVGMMVLVEGEWARRVYGVRDMGLEDQRPIPYRTVRFTNEG